MKPGNFLALTTALWMGLGSVALAATDDYPAPTIGTMQVTPKQAKHKKDKPVNIKIDAPKLDLGVSSSRPGLTSFAIKPATSPKTQPGASGRGPVIKPLRPISMPAPGYPRAALASRASPTVKVMFTIRKDGHTDDIRIMTSDTPDAFQQATRDAVARWRFQPKTVDGQPQVQRVTQTIRFTPPPPPAPAPKHEPPSRGRGPVLSGPAPVPVHIVPPEYPRAAALRRTQGYVIVAFTVNSDGRTSDVQVVSSSPRRVFDAAARAAVEQWRFKPYRIDGKAASIRVKQRIQFSP